jgi:hypothetical protein
MAVVALGLAAACGNGVEDGGAFAYFDAAFEAAPERLVLGLDAGGPGSPGSGTDPGSGAGGTGGASGGSGSTSGGGGGGGGGTATNMSCNVARMDCMTGQMCLPSVFAEKEDTGGICYPAGDKSYMQACALHQNCGPGLVCSPNGDEGCRYGCDPTAPACPDGGKCVELPRYRRTGYCGPA